MNITLARNISLTFISLILISIVSEAILRCFYNPLNSGWGWNDSPRKSLAEFENDLPNQLGVRGQQINYTDDDFIIVLLGDSQVEAATCAPRNMPEILIENQLNDLQKGKFKVFSLAASGWGQDQQLLTLKKYYEDFRADLILVWVTPKNDFWENTFPDRSTSQTAGHLKPTYRFLDDELVGPYIKSNSFYKESALLQLFFSAIQEVKGESIEQLILNNWKDDLPAPHDNSTSSFKYKKNGKYELDLNVFSEKLFEYSDRNNLTILTHEDFVNSRSHFSPYLTNKTDRDRYLVNITKKLFEQINELALLNGSKMITFYPIREDFDIVYKNCVRFIKSYKNINLAYSVNLDYLATLKEITNPEQLIYFKLDGKDEICVDKRDRHLNNKGNKQVAEKLVQLLKDELPIEKKELNSI